MNKQSVSESMMKTIEEYHLSMRMKQLSVQNDPVYGYTAPYCVYSHDQVPIELAAKNEVTLDTTGVDEVYDSTTKDGDQKRFATLNVFVPMIIREDGLGVPPPHLVFRGKFQTSEEWHHQDEIAQWHPAVVGSFHENAWADARTHMHGLKKELPNFDPPIFVPPNMTSYLQVVDRHIGVRYKNYVYKEYRKEMLKRLRATMTSLNMNTDAMKLTPKEKRILITHAVGTIHEKLCKSDAFKRAFHATGTWLPINHLIRDESTLQNATVNNATVNPTDADKSVDIQHFKEYKYTEKITPEAVYAAIDKAAADRAVAEAEARRVAAKKEAYYHRRTLNYSPSLKNLQSCYLSWKGSFKPTLNLISPLSIAIRV
eukprot:scaffold37180_cov23-Cyclotella_meneghiniana.AAC.2